MTTKMGRKRDQQTEAGVTLGTLEETPNRAVTFLRAIGINASIRAAMMTRGYNAADHREGWNLLQASSGFTEVETKPVNDEESAKAMSEIDAADEDVFRLVRSCGRKHPEAIAFLLKDLGPSVGARAVIGMRTLLDRLDELEKGKDRRESRQEDAAALAMLADRGLHAEERKRLRDLVKVAQKLGEVELRDVEREEAGEGERIAALSALRGWYTEWSEVARAAIKRRASLIQLGLANPRSRAGDEIRTREETTPIEEEGDSAEL